MTVEAISPVLVPLLEWADQDPEVRMQTSSIEAFRAGFEAAGKSAEPIAIAPSIVLLAPSTRRAFAAVFREAGKALREAGRLERAQACEDRADALDFGGEADLSTLLEAI